MTNRMNENKITFENGKLNVPNHPVIPFREGDGIGPDMESKQVMDAAIEKAQRGSKKIEWKEVYAGEKAYEKTGEWLPEDILKNIREYLVALKGLLATPIGGGMRSLIVPLRQQLDLYACVRPVRWYPGVPSPVKSPEKVNMVIYRENTEDIYAGIEWMSGTSELEHEIYRGEVQGMMLEYLGGQDALPI